MYQLWKIFRLFSRRFLVDVKYIDLFWLCCIFLWLALELYFSLTTSDSSICCKQYYLYMKQELKERGRLSRKGELEKKG